MTSLVCCRNPQKVKWQFLVGLSAALSFLMTGFVRGYSSPGVPSMKRRQAHDLNGDTIALIASMPASGAMMAALLSGICLKYFGN